MGLGVLGLRHSGDGGEQARRDRWAARGPGGVLLGAAFDVFFSVRPRRSVSSRSLWCFLYYGPEEFFIIQLWRFSSPRFA